MLISLSYTILGFILLIVGGELVVKHSSIFATKLGISPLVVGLTVVAFGTSAPELAVSLMASYNGNIDIAVTNVVGSNIFNTAFILGACGLVAPLIVELKLLKLDIPLSVIATLIFFYFARDGRIGHGEGALFLVSLCAYLIWLVKASRKEQTEQEKESHSPTSKRQLVMILLFIALGIITLVFGSNFLVKGASALAISAGISEAVVGLTLVAAGTSFPELISSLMATIKGKTDIAIGNVIGSNIFNILFILGSSSVATTKGLNISNSILKFDLPALVFLAFLSLILLVTHKKIVKWEGFILLTSYIAYTFFLFIRL